MILLETQNLTKTYKIGERQVDVLKDVSLKIEAGETVAIMGSSGSGKTTLLSLLSGLDQPTNGRVWVEAEDITDKTEDELAPLRNQTIGFVFQSFHLVPSLTAIENIMFPAELDADPMAQAKAETLMKRVGIWDRAHNFPHQLSGGEKQRVAICRALINEPKIVFTDEPTGNLDSANSAEILDLLFELHREQGATLVLVTHDMNIANMADRVIHLRDGEIVIEGTGQIDGEPDSPTGAMMHRTFIYRQITSSIKQTSVFIACVALSIVTLVSIGGFGESVNNALLRDARVLLAGDIVVQSGFPFQEPLVTELDRLRSDPGTEVALTYQFITIVRTSEGEDSLLSELKVVEPGYPFYGEVVTLSGRSLSEGLKKGQVVVAQNLLDRLGLQVGDALKIGEITTTIVDVVLGEPDQPVDFFSLGPRIFLSADDLDATGLVQPGSRVNYRALVRVADETQIEALAERLSAVADKRQVRVDTYRTNQSAVQLFFDNFLTFLSLIGIFTLFLAGIGIQSSLSSFIREREETIAVLRTFGATGRFIMVQFLGITAILGISGTLIGLALGILLQWLFPILFGSFLPPQVEFSLSLRAIVEGMLLGFVVVSIFTFLPIYQLQGFKPRFIFRKEPSETNRGWIFFASQGMILLFLTAMTYRYLGDLQQTAYFSIGIVTMVLLITILARAVLYLLRKRKIAALDVRQALRGLVSPA